MITVIMRFSQKEVKEKLYPRNAERSGCCIRSVVFPYQDI